MKGFSLIEIIIVIGIVSIIGSISVITFNTMRQVGDTKHAVYVFVDALKEAKNKAKMMEYDTDWGVKLTNTDAVIFSGTSYGARVLIRDKVYDIPNNLSVSGPTEVVFSKFSGISNVTGTTVFSNAFSTSSSYILNGGVIGY